MGHLRINNIKYSYMKYKNITYMEKYGLSEEEKRIIDQNLIDFNVKYS